MLRGNNQTGAARQRAATLDDGEAESAVAVDMRPGLGLGLLEGGGEREREVGVEVELQEVRIEDKEDKEDKEEEEEGKWEEATGLTLRTVEQTPVFWRRAFILSGYRVYYPLGLCLRSLFAVHNETGNCWTHLVGFVGFGVANAGVVYSRNVHDRAYLVVYLLGVQVCMLFSVLFHLLSCHSYHTFLRYLKLDLCGISIQILASYVPAIHFAFYCSPVWQLVYLTAIALFALLGVVAPYLEFMHRPENEKWRQLLYISMTCSGIIPCIHWAYATSSPEFNLFVGYLVGMFACYAIGVLVYLANIPERLAPGKFDIWFHSHQWWHVFVMAAAFSLLVGCVKYSEFHDNTTC